jgi:predicted RND superfamily exporter protein
MGNRASGRLFRLLWVIWAAIILVELAALAGASRLRFDDGIQSAFASDNEWYRNYARFAGQFTQSDGDIAVLLRADDFADPAALGAVADFVIEAQLIEGVEGAYSVFAVPAGIGPDGVPRSALPLDLPPAGELAPLLDRLIADNPAAARLMSADRTLTAVFVTVEGSGFDLAATRRISAELDALAARATSDAGVSHTVTGLPLLRAAIIDDLFSDLWFLNVVGILTGFVVCVASLRSIPLGLVATVPSSTALLWALGAVSMLGFSINVVTVALPVLVLVLSFADSLHLTFEARRLYRDGRPPPEVPLLALRRVGGACAVATVTTAFAFGGLLLSDSALIRELGLAGIVATLVALVTVLVVHLAVVAAILRFGFGDRVFAAASDRPLALFDWRALPRFGLARPIPVAGASLLLLAAAAAIYPAIEPVYSARENIRASDPLAEALETIEARLTPTAAVDIPVRLTRNISEGLDRASLERVAAVQQVASQAAGGAPAVSIAGLAAGEDATDPGTVEAMLAQMSETQRRRLVSADGNHALVRLYVPDEGARAGRALTARIEAALAADPGLEAGDHARPTGFLVMSSFMSAGMILDLNISFLAAVAASGVFIALWFRNLRYGLVALLPNILPILLVGAWLAVSGRGLQFSSGIALTIAFGIAVDDTVHILNRLRLHAPKGRPFDRAALGVALAEATPVLVVTTAVLSIGLLGTLFATIPTIAWFGILSIAVFLLAILADLVVLPAWLVILADSRGRARRH